MTRHVRSWALAALAAFALAGAATPSLAGITYNVTNYALGQNDWTVNGTITVSGAGTFTDASAITAWDITLSKPLTGSYQFKNGLSGHDGLDFLGSTTLTATTSKLDLLSPTIFSFRDETYDNMLAWQNLDAFKYVGKINGSIVFDSTSYSPSNNGVYTIGTASGVPEIDPATGGSALSLVAGVLAMIEQRRRRAMLVA